MEKRHYKLIEAAAVMLFTMQAVRVLLAMLFARVYDTLFDGEGAPILATAGLLCVVMIILPLLSPRSPKKLDQTLRLSAILCAIARIPLSLDMPLLRLFAAIATLSFSGLYVATLLSQQAKTLVPALSLGLFIDQFLRALGHTYDLSLRPWWIIVQIPLSIGVIVLAAQGARQKSDSAAAEPAGFLAGISYGAILFMLSSLYALPNAAARWTGGSYALMVAAMMAATTIPLLPPISNRFAEGAPLRALLRKALTFVIVLMGLTLADQGGLGVATISLIVGLLGFWLLLPHSLSVGTKGAGAGLVVGMVLFIILAIAHAFSFTYAYTISDFEGMGLPTFLAATVLALGPGLLRSRDRVTARPLHKGRLWLIAGTVCLVSATLYAFPWPMHLEASTETIALGTYNIHYGFDSHWHLSLEEQARTIEASGADVIALQEVDTGRLTSYGIDDALWLSRRLDMEIVYLPTVEFW